MKRALIPRISLLLLAFCVALSVIGYPARADEGTIVFQEDFEDGWGLWWVDNGVWEIGTPMAGPEAPHSGTACAGTNLDGNYPANTDSWLVSPAMTLPSVGGNEEIVLRFWDWHSYFNEPYTTDDQGCVSVATYEDGVWSEFSESLRTVSLYSLLWSTLEVDLSDYAGMRIRIGFYHQDNHGSYGNQSTGWYIDDLLVEKRPTAHFDMSAIEGFENDWGNWYTTNGVWQVGEPTAGPESAYSGSSCIGTNLGGNYFVYTGSRMISPIIDLPANCLELYLRFWQWFSYFNEPYTTDDSGYVQIRTFEDGAWSDWETVLTNQLSSGNWSPAIIDVLHLAGKKIQICFYHQDYHGSYGGQSSGWYIDDLEFIGICGTVDASLNCQPASGTVPFTSLFQVKLKNQYAGQTRRIHYNIDVTVGGGHQYTSWRRGWQNIPAGQEFNRQWGQTMPNWPSIHGDNIFAMTATDVTPAPYNQPPYPPAGDTDTDSCTVTCFSP